jgi:hypothetical protein
MVPTGAGEGKPAAVVVTQVLDVVPTEIHVFMSLTMGLPVYVETPAALSPPSTEFRTWKVDGDRISLVQPSPGAGAHRPN